MLHMPNLARISLSLSPDELRRLDEIALEWERSRSQTARQIIKAWMMAEGRGHRPLGADEREGDTRPC
jgi:predicted transcriptional regulator